MLSKALVVSVALGAGCWSSDAPAPINSGTPQPTKPIAKPRPVVDWELTAVEPERGDFEGGTYVRLLGKDFIKDGPVAAKVYFGTTPGEIVRFASATELIVQAPGGKDGEVVDVRVVLDGRGEFTLPKAFTFVDRSSNP